MSEVFEMPIPDLGETVYFWKHGLRTGEKDPAIVLAVGKVTCRVRNLMTGAVIDGVRHAADPQLRVGEQARQGCWEFTAQGIAWREIEHKVFPNRKKSKFEAEPTIPAGRVLREPTGPPRGAKTAAALEEENAPASSES